MKHFLSFFYKFFLIFLSYLWYFALYLIVIPYVVILIGKNLDILIFNYFLSSDIPILPNVLKNVLVGSLVLISVILILWSFFSLYYYSRFFPLSIAPYPFFNPKKLNTTGPYAIVRHPMVLGYLITLVGYGFYKDSLCTVFVIIPMMGLFFFEYLENREERRLAMWFGKEYDQYKKNTPLLIPIKKQ